MVFRDSTCLYEQPAVQRALGETLRPGGLELTRRALAQCALPCGARVLDVGCGAGVTTQYLQDSGYRASGVDLSTTLLEQGRSREARLALVQADGERLPMAAGCMSAVFAECSLSVFASIDLALAEFNRVLSPGGYLILSDLYACNPAGLAALQALSLSTCLNGMMLQEALLASLARSQFGLKVWEDHSEVMRQLVERLAATPAVLAQFRGSATARGTEALDMQIAIARAKPGYFLLVAQKH